MAKTFIPNLKFLIHRLTHFWPFFIFGLAFFAFAAPFILYQKIPFPGDLLVGAYYPWLDYKWGYPIGVPVKNPLISDVFSQFAVWKYYGIQSLKNGQIPFWDWSIFNGMPFFSTLHTGILYPLNFIYFLLPNYFWIAHSIFLLFQPILAFTFSYLLFSSWNNNKFISTFAALTFAFSGFMMVWFEWGNIGHTLLWLPLLILITDKLFHQNIKPLTTIPLTTFILTCSFTAGHIQTFFYVFILWAAYFGFYTFISKNFTSHLATFIFIILSFITLNLFQIIPFINLVQSSIRGTEGYIQQHNFGLFPFKQWLTWWAPDIWGNPTTYNYHGFWNYQEFTPFIGTITYLLIISLTLYLLRTHLSSKTKTTPLILFFFSSFLFIIFLINPITGKIIYLLHLPLLSTASASRLTSLLSFIIPSLLVLSYPYLISKPLSFFRHFITTTLSWLILIITIDTLKYLGWLNWYIPNKVFFRNQILPLGLTLSSIFLITLYFKLSSLLSSNLSNYLKKLILLTLLILQLFDLVRFGKKYNPFTDQKLTFSSTPVTDFLVKNKLKGRIITYNSDPLLPHNTGMYYSLSYADGYHPLVPKLQASFINLVNNNIFQPSSRYGKINNINSDHLKYAAVKYLLLLKRTKIDQYSPTGTIKIQPPFYRKIFENKTTVILENTQSYPFTFIYKDNSKIEPTSSIGKVTNYQQKTNSISITYTTTQAARLFLSHSYSPNWHARLDNQKTLPISKTHYIFMSIPIPAGTHTITLTYLPPFLKVLFPISLATAIILLTISIKSFYEK